MKWKSFDEILQDARGVPIGRVQTYRRPLTSAERRACSMFLESVTRNQNPKPKEIPMATSKTETRPENQNEKCNMAFLAGAIKKLSVSEGDGFLLLDCGPDNRFIPCTIYKEPELLKRIDGFAEGDFIQIRGFVRPWSKKVDNEWENHMEVRVTEIKNKPPRREAARPRVTDDDSPF